MLPPGYPRSSAKLLKSPNAKPDPSLPCFKVDRVAVIYDDLAYTSARGIYLIRDNDTGKEYMGLSGVGVSELGSHSKMVGKVITTEPDER